MQLQKMKGGGGGGAGAGAGNVFNVLSGVVKSEGVAALWKGNGANCVRVMPVYGLKFGLNDKIKDKFRQSPGARLGRAEQMAAGTSAGTFTTLMTYPLDMIRTRLSMAKGHGVEYRGILDCGLTTLKQEGAAGLYKGLGMTILSGSPYVGLQMTAFEVFKGERSIGRVYGSRMHGVNGRRVDG